MKKKILIIGGGITGCMCAIYLRKKGHSVSIYDARKNLGGILNDINYKDNIFFRGVQYFDLKNIWFKDFYEFGKNDLKIFDHIYGSFTEFNNEIIVSNDYAVPIVNLIKNKKLNRNSKKIKKTLEDRFKFYNTDIKTFMTKLVKKFNLDPEQLSFKSSQPLQLSRIASKNNETEVEKFKKQSQINDDIYAIRRSKINSKFIKASLPKKSFNLLFMNIMKKLKKAGVNVELKTKVHPIWKNKKLNILYKGKEIKNDYVFWTGNPTDLIKNYNKKKLQSLATKILIISADLLNKEIITKYIQVFSIKTKIIKIYIYYSGQKPKISIESVFQKNINKNEIINEAIKILKKFKIKIKIDKQSINSAYDVRYNVVSYRDHKIIENFIENTKKTNLIAGSWLKYSRDERIDLSISRLKNLKLI